MSCDAPNETLPDFVLTVTQDVETDISLNNLGLVSAPFLNHPISKSPLPKAPFTGVLPKLTLDRSSIGQKAPGKKPCSLIKWVFITKLIFTFFTNWESCARKSITKCYRNHKIPHVYMEGKRYAKPCTMSTHPRAHTHKLTTCTCQSKHNARKHI